MSWDLKKKHFNETVLLSIQLIDKELIQMIDKELITIKCSKYCFICSHMLADSEVSNLSQSHWAMLVDHVLSVPGVAAAFFWQIYTLPS